MKIVFMGTPDFSVPILRQLIEDGYEVVACVTQPDRPKGRKRELTPPPVKVEALNNGIDVIQPEKLKNEKELERIFSYSPDLIVTAAFGQILPKVLLDFPKFGCVNVHASLLPKYRGGAPIHQSIIDGQTETGITIMYMVEKLDAGDILTQTIVPIEESDHVGTLHNKLSVAGAKLLSKTIPALINGELTPIQQNEDEATFASNITRDKEKIDWKKDGDAIYNQIRGLHPWPVAYTSLDNKIIKIWWGVKQQTNKVQPPGTIIDIVEDGIIIATGSNIAIKITELQPAGKKRMSAEQFLHGIGAQIEIGMMLGE